MADNILQAQGFEREIGGGGCVILSQYLESDAFVWATCLDGGGLPDPDNWMVCAYGDDIDAILFESRSDDESGLSLEQAIEQALSAARNFTSEYALCRNGRPIAGCTCC